MHYYTSAHSMEVASLVRIYIDHNRLEQQAWSAGIIAHLNLWILTVSTWLMVS